jgi:hypothetical protein
MANHHNGNGRNGKPVNGNGSAISRWRKDPAAFIVEALINPQTDKPFELFEAEKVFLQHAFTPTADGDLPYKDIVWSCIKKSGKSTFGALCLLYTVICLGGKYAESYVISNDLAQAQDRIFTSAARIIEASPLIKARVTASRITFSNGSFIEALPADYRGAAGVEPVMVIADEIWAFSTEASQRLYEECCPTPTRKPSVRMVTSYAGFTGESVLLENLINRGMAGRQIAKDLYEQPGIIAFVSHERIAPWQSLQWFEEARRSTRPTAFQRQYLNEFAAAESQFIPIEEWDACTDKSLRPVLSDHGMTIFVGLDCSVRRDTTAIVAATVDTAEQRVRVVAHKCFRPTGGTAIDFAEVETALKDLEKRFTVASVTYDPFQAEYLAQRLHGAGIRMQALPQTSSNLTQAASTLSELILGRNLVTYASDELREAVRNAAIVESARGMRLAKERPGAKIDLLAALSFAVLTAVREGPLACVDLSKLYEYYGGKVQKEPEPATPAQPEADIAPEDGPDEEGKRDAAAWWRGGVDKPPPAGFKVVRETGKPVSLVWIGRQKVSEPEPVDYDPYSFEHSEHETFRAQERAADNLPGPAQSHFRTQDNPRMPFGGASGLPSGAARLAQMYMERQAQYGGTVDPRLADLRADWRRK